MSENDVLIQPLTATVGFTRKTAVNSQYNNCEVSLYLPVEIPKASDFTDANGFDAEAYFKQIDGNLRTGFTTAKALVLEQLGLEFEDVNGVITEKVVAAFPGSTAEGPQAPRQQAQRASAPAAAPSAGMPASCPQCHGAEFYDNRPKKASGEYKPKAPDFKCKGCSKGIWTK